MIVVIQKPLNHEDSVVTEVLEVKNPQDVKQLQAAIYGTDNAMAKLVKKMLTSGRATRVHFQTIKAIQYEVEK